jgi:hypothetical protein
MNPREPGAVELHCRRCGVQIAGENIDLASAVARCHRCQAVFGFADHLPEDKPAPLSMNMPMPRGLTIFEHGGTLQLVRRWFGLGTIVTLLLCIAFDTYLVLAFTTDAYAGLEFPESLVPIILVAGGVVATYTTIAGLLNRTIIEAGATYLTLRHIPVPWRGNRKIPVSELQQLFCQAHEKRKSSTTYSLNAVLGNGRTLRLLEDLSEAKQVLFLEHALEKHLGIVNQPVPGALRG